jgi:hypothetical protein
MRATRPFYYGRWDERTQAHAATAPTDREPPGGARLRRRREEVDVPALLGALRAVERRCSWSGGAGRRDRRRGGPPGRRLLPDGRDGGAAAAGHFPWVDEPEAFRSAVTGFLSRVGA